jgi:DNA-binding LacI/PurR family transcriptional regulator
MPAPAKYTEVMSVIQRRIDEGDYLLSSIPGERKIAEDTGVSYMTARRAVSELLELKVLTRHPSGALDVHPSYAKRTRPAEVVLLYPAYASTYLTQLRGLVSEFADEREVRLRPVQFVHWDESTVVEAAAQARGAIVIPSGEPIPPRLIDSFKAKKIVMLDGDYSDVGITSIRLFSQASIQKVLDHLYNLGHRQIDCVNTQNQNAEIRRLIEIWRQWIDRKGMAGRLWDNPAAPYTDPTIAAYKLMSRLLDNGQIEATALVGTTCPAAIGMMRSSWERGVQVGKELSICAMNIEPPAEFFCPSITGLQMPKLATVLGTCFDWIFGPDQLDGAKLLEPKSAALFEGESTRRPSGAPVARK